MGYSEADLERFGSFVMKEAAEKRMHILKEAEQNRKRILEEKELEFLEKAYLFIQKEIGNINRKKNEMISDAYMKSKKILLQKREEIIENIFTSVENKVREFIHTPEYVHFLINCIKEGIEAAGEGEKVIYINARDAQFIDIIKEKTKRVGNLEILKLKDDIIGGCRVLNKTGNKFIDNSLYARLQHEKEEFLKTSGLFIEPSSDR